MKTDGPILITGAFRSGTTLIAQIIKNHPKIEFIYDSVNFMRFSFEKYNPLSNFENVKALVSEVRERIAERWDMHFDEKKVIKKLQNQKMSYEIIYDNLMRELLLEESDAEIWGEKTTLVWTKIPAFFEMFPNGRVIHIIRDPRAILLSWKKMTNAPGNDYLDAILNCRDSMALMEEYKIRFKNKRYASIRYEDLVYNPKEVINEICSILDLDYNEKMLDSTVFSDKSGGKWTGNSMFKDKINGISSKMVDIWKTKLEEWEIWLTDFIIGEYMDKFNYKKMEIERNAPLIQRIIQEVQSSKLVTDGILYFLLTDEGYERFPSDPIDPKNWDRKMKTKLSIRKK